jgi:hypothetical protein
MVALTDEERDNRKWTAAQQYIQAYADWRAIRLRYATFSPEGREAWRNLMAKRNKYRKAAKL